MKRTLLPLLLAAAFLAPAKAQDVPEITATQPVISAADPSFVPVSSTIPSTMTVEDLKAFLSNSADVGALLAELTSSAAFKEAWKTFDLAVAEEAAGLRYVSNLTLDEAAWLERASNALNGKNIATANLAVQAFLETAIGLYHCYTAKEGERSVEVAVLFARLGGIATAAVACSEAGMVAGPEGAIAGFAVGLVLGIICPEGAEAIVRWMDEQDIVGEALDFWWFDRDVSQKFNEWLYNLRYGENPHLKDDVYQKTKRLVKGDDGKYHLMPENNDTDTPSDHPFAQSVIDTVQDIISAVLPSDDAIDIAETLWEIGGCFGSDGPGSVPQALLDKLIDALPVGPARDAAQTLAKKIADGISNVSIDDILSLGTSTVQGKIAEALVQTGLSAAEAAKIAANTASEIVSSVTGGGIVGTSSAITGNGIIGTPPTSTITGGGIVGAIKTKIGEVVYNTIEHTISKDAADKWEQVWTDIKSGTDPWSSGSIQDAAKETAIVLVNKAIDKLGDMAWKRIEALAAKYPAVATAMQALGINKQGLINAAKNIWGAITGPGSIADRFKTLAMQTAAGLAKMAKNLISWLGAKFAGWLNSQISKIAGKIWAKIQKWISRLPTFGGRINYAKIYNALVAKLGGLVTKGVQAVVTPIATKVETAITNAAYNVIYGSPSTSPATP